MLHVSGIRLDFALKIKKETGLGCSEALSRTVEY